VEIKYFNRHSGQVEIEKVYGDKAIEWLYESTSGKLVSSGLAKAPASIFYGILQDMPWSKGKISNFCQTFNIDLEDFQPEEGRENKDRPYSNFNKFFIRKFKPGKREFVSNSTEMAAFSEARYFGYESISDDDTIPVKGVHLNAKELLANEKWTETFQDGPLLLARLCPVDYHRFHYPDDGIVIDYYKVKGAYHSVNPLALKAKENIFSTNVREVTILETENFGKLAYVEVGAIFVGRIVQSSDLKTFKKGDEKGYFLFGGSTVIVLGEKGRWKPSNDIILNTKKGMETYLHLGTSVGLKM
jgi:phosphatidylserine decarboxylase